MRWSASITVAFLVLHIAVAANSCRLDGFRQTNFLWNTSQVKNHSVTFENKYGHNCPLNNYQNHPVLRRINKPKTIILTIGDSLDEGPCVFMMNRKVLTPYPDRFSEIKELKVDNHGLFNCSSAVPNLDVVYYTIHGSTVDNKTEIDYFSETEVGLKLLGERMNSVGYIPTHITFGSFAWDMQAAYLAYCYQFQIGLVTPTSPHHGYKYEVKDPSHISCMCNSTMRRTECAASPYEIFQGLSLPWCSDAVHDFWKESYMKNVQLLHSYFPKAMIYLRTQPPSAIVKMGNSYCQNYMNNQIRYWVRSGEYFSYLRLMDYDSLLQSQIGRSFDKMHYSGDRIQWNDLLVNTVLDSYL